ncbi:MAG: prepilin-type N-terminal cleavage/methylation domain-containing protein [Candidatus Staskawiczbacteria bacterium]|jgi:prepilin-type N-terminal cleavage/methylation domain-containing protein
MNKSKGFTIIELIVVIAIIAVLAAIVLVNVTGYINKSKNAAVEGNLASIMTNGADYFATNPSNYGSTFIATTLPQSAITAATTAVPTQGTNAATSGGVTTTQAWCACNPLYAITGSACTTAPCSFCVDSTGNKKVAGAACSAECVTGSSWVCQ